jgi:acyl-CoA thioester hydrolase
VLCCQIETRTGETNATGHIDHTVIPAWFEQARTPIYRLFNPELSFANWNTVIKKIEVDYVSQIYYGRRTEVRSTIAEIRNTSFTIRQELWQDDKLTASGRVILVHFDYQAGQKTPIPPSIRSRLQTLMP